MKGIFQIYRRDLHAVITNYAALIVILALCILPSLYAWFNIKASWDPYGPSATSGIKVGVVNLDTGADLNGTDIKIGDTIVDELKKNKQLGWQFVTAKEARKALNEERYYAVITIEENFSKHLISIVSGNITKGQIKYTVNEKMNAVAPKLTDKGVTNLQNMVSKTVVETVSTAIFEAFNEIGINLEKQMPNITNAYQKLLDIQSRFGQINQLVADSDTGLVKAKQLIDEVNTELPKIQTTIKNSQALGQQIIDFASTAQNTVSEIAPVVLNDLTILEGYGKSVYEGLAAIKQAAVENPEYIGTVIGQTQDKLSAFDSINRQVVALLQKFLEMSPNEQLQGYLQTLSGLEEKLANLKGLLANVDGMTSDEILSYAGFNEILGLSQSIYGTVTQVHTQLEQNLIPMLNSIFTNAITVAGQVNEILQDALNKIPDVKQLITIANSSINQGETGMAYVKKNLPIVEEKINELTAKIKEVNTDQGLEDLIGLLKSDVEARSGFLANPVEIKEERLYPMHNYGTSMTPFYTVLSLWVGILLLVSMLTVDAHGDYKVYQVYFGKLLLFATIAVVQALIVSIGDLYLLGIYCLNPALFIVGSLFIGIIFAVIVYSLISIFGNVGKVIAIILLVLQVSGSGGTFPIQLTPRFFQRLNPFLPFTYGISFEREAIGGVVRAVLMRDLWILIIFGAVFIILALLLKKPINRYTSKFQHRFNESGLGEH